MKTRKTSAPPEHTQVKALLALLEIGERERKRGLLRPLSEIVQRLRQKRTR
ncbi:MAG: hypothetical protein M1449_14280 [Candidatus Thermoplasmatota archaeon]|nr:hypothetical protein [Candidatus Thermoplasmatota archaeon]MCL5061507.1 hypothetical protein [Candidatus Thermoplasmatota archaeon]